MSTITYIILAIVAIIVFLVVRRYRMFTSGMGAEESDKLLILTDQNYKHQIKQGVVLIDFWAIWCQPCKIQGPIVSLLAEENNNPEVKIAKLDIEKNPRAAQEFGIQNIPTMLILKDGKLVDKLVGMKSKKVLEKALEKVGG